MLLQIVHSRTFSFASRIASDSAKACSLSTRSRKNARRCAVFCPIPGRRFNSSINRVTEGAKSAIRFSSYVRNFEKKLLGGNPGSDRGSAAQNTIRSEQAGNLHAH